MKRKETITVRVSDLEKASIRKLSFLNFMTMSDFVRQQSLSSKIKTNRNNN